MEGEDAFLASMGAQDYNPAYEDPEQEGDDEEEEEDEDYDPSSFLPNNTDAPSPPTPKIATDSASLQPVKDSALASVISPNASQAPSRTALRMSDAQAATQADPKPVVLGGFIEEEDDDDDEEEDEKQPEPMLASGDGGIAVASTKSPSQAPPGSISQTPVPANVQVYNPPQDTAVSHVVPNGAAELPSVSIPPNDGIADVEGKAGEPTPQPVPAPSQSIASSSAALTSSLPKARLPNDIVGQFEDRIKDDPKGDVDAWMGLIGHYRSKNKYEEARMVYTRFFEVFPTAGDQWVAYAQMELENDDLQRLEMIFQAALMKAQSIPLWSIYLDHVRRRNDLAMDTSGQGRQVVSQAYDFVLAQIGMDKDSGQIWHDYITFIKSGPGTVGGTAWQDAQKMDLVRKAYQRAICVPMQNVTTLWKEYDTFELGLNKMTGRKFLQEKSPSYVTARSSFTQLQNIARDLKRGVTPKLPPMPGFGGDEDYHLQVQLWQKWVEWEKEDPLVLKDEDIKAYQQRVLYVFKQAVMALRFWPQMWYDAAEFCFANGMDTEGTEFLANGMQANPESCLLAFKRADRIEQTMQDDGEDGAKRRGDTVTEQYNSVLDAMYALIEKVTQREPAAIARIEDYFASLPPESRQPSPEEEEDDDDQAAKIKPLSRDQQKAQQIAGIQGGTKAQIKLISKTLTFVWISLMRAMRRIQGKGKPGEKLGGMRQVFTDARKRGRLTSDLYVASALMEHNCYRDPAATKIFERGIKLFPQDESFALEYTKHLIASGDVTNARAVFETTVSKITAKAENIPRAKALYQFMHDFESKFGEVAQINNLEKRMAELYPADRSMTRFSQRFSTSHVDFPVFDPCGVRLIVSPTQTRPKEMMMPPVPTIETAPPAIAQSGYVQSPKRPMEDSDAEQPARKMMRGESPLKGAAGRRQQQQRQAREQYGSHLGGPAPPKPLPAQISALLSIIPPARSWIETRFHPERMVDLIRSVDMTRANVPAASGGAPQNYGYTYGR